MNSRQFLPELQYAIRRNLAETSVERIDSDCLRRAAVAIVVMEHPQYPGLPCFALTRRVSRMSRHAGQYALPGGKLDRGETAQRAALRELEEELGLSVTENDIMGCLDDYATRSGFCITPVVMWAETAADIQPNPDEVAEVFYVPLCELENDGLIVLEPGESSERPVFSIDLPTIGHQIYAPTAAMIYQFYECGMNGNSIRVSHYDQPRFAWK
ncbi:MAG: CoA pyrophosphatase [Pseudomonadota bacterium]